MCPHASGVNYAVRRPGIFSPFYFTLCAVSYDFGSQLALRMWPRASGVMLPGAQGFFTHFVSPCVQCRAILGPQWCQVLLIWWYVWCKFCVSVRIVCTSGIVGSKNVPACVRGYAVRRPGIFYTFYCTLRAVSFDFGSTMVSSSVNLVIGLVLVLCKCSYCVHNWYCWLKECARMSPGLCC